MSKEKVVVVCPGRGSYSRDSSGYLNQHLSKKSKNSIELLEINRNKEKLIGPLELDATPFKSSVHMKGENASILIYACSLNDFLSIISPLTL